MVLSGGIFTLRKARTATQGRPTYFCLQLRHDYVPGAGAWTRGGDSTYITLLT